MDYRCPVCKADLKRRKLSQAVVARMEIDCSHCKSRIRTNVHRAERIVVLAIFGAIIALVALSYWFQSRGLALFAFGSAMAGALALPLIEHTYLRNWPRYELIVKKSSPQQPQTGQ